MNSLWMAVNLLANVVETFVLFKFLSEVVCFKYSRWMMWTSIGLLSVLTLIINQSGSHYLSILFFPVLFIIVHFLFEGVLTKKLIGFGMVLMTSIIIDNVTVFLIMNILNVPLDIILENTLYRLFALMISKISLYFIYFLYIKIKSKNDFATKFDPITSIHISVFFISAIYIMVLFIIIYKRLEITDPRLNTYISLLVLSIGLMCIFALMLYNNIIKSTQEHVKLRLQIQQAELKNKYSREVNLSIDNLRSIKHDMSNHLSAIKGLAELKEYEKLDEYLDELARPLGKADEIMITNHPVVSSIIYSKSLIAEQEKIDLKIETRLDDDIMIHDQDITILFGNVLDNAIEACSRINSNFKEIRLMIKSLKGYLIVDCENTMDTKNINFENNKLLTSKMDKVNHGIGLENVKRIIEKYHGGMEIAMVDGIFSIKITLKNDAPI